MASTNKTTNYELSQFIETDKPGWLTDYNSDMRKLDTALKGVSDIASGASGSISSLADRMTAAEGAINTNANDIDALEARADVLEAQAQSSAGAITSIQTEQTVQNAGIEAATELGYNLARPYDSASTYAVGAYVLFQNTLYKCITAVSTGEAFDPTKWLAIKATDEIAAGGYTLPIASASQLGGVKVGSGLNIDGGGVLSASGGDAIANDLISVTFRGHGGITPAADTQVTIQNQRSIVTEHMIISFINLEVTASSFVYGAQYGLDCIPTVNTTKTPVASLIYPALTGTISNLACEGSGALTNYELHLYVGGSGSTTNFRGVCSAVLFFVFDD